MTKLFAPGNDVNSTDNRAAVKKALMDYSQLSAADADKTINEWTTSYNNLKTELDRTKAAAEEKAKVAADQAASNLSTAAMWAFFALLIGLAVTSLAGRFGAQQALLHQEIEWREAGHEPV